MERRKLDTLRQRRQNGKRRKLQKRCMVLFWFNDRCYGKGFVNLPQSDDPNGKWSILWSDHRKNGIAEQYIGGYKHIILIQLRKDGAWKKILPWRCILLLQHSGVTGLCSTENRQLMGTNIILIQKRTMVTGEVERDGRYYYYDDETWTVT